MSTLAARKTATPLQHWRALFDTRWNSTDALTALRREALEEFLSAGFPTIRQEDWKYTNLRRLDAREFTFADADASEFDTQGASATPGEITKIEDAAALQAQWIANPGVRIVLVNGRWTPKPGSTGAHPPGLTLLSLGQWGSQDADAAAKFLSEARIPRSGEGSVSRRAPEVVPFNSRQGIRPPVRRTPLEQLNLAFSEDGIIIELADGMDIEPVYIVHQMTAPENTNPENDQENMQSAAPAAMRMVHPRIIVRTGRNSRCTLIEHFLGPADTEYFTNAVTHIEVGQGATMTHYRLQTESPRSFHIAHIDAHVQAAGRYACYDIALGANLARVGLSTALDGPGAHAALYGLFVPLGTQHLDAHTRIDHLAAHTTSEEDYRGVAGGRGRGVFNGKVIVHPGAQKIDARQSSRNLLLSSGAQIDTKPELEIYADDVKCAHGATTGQLDTTALFYLRSRGLSEDDARALLIRAFAESILTRIEPVALREQLEHHLDERFATAQDSREAPRQGANGTQP
ncbi:hypothetical protein ACG33_10990 [Steroidobacter denitrificans]|uniref:Fe-S cluster assembly protein SufD n=1 Tax=Steroidobacter denitrificans TaxID=465721 RepID=A0A127FB13_STEDE|nr:Fe-S cluster assembly protein SufD [Steroidobacter denitrificans]AMN47614.1 hypothetical protein ACG33_10990 [Steroidobacter denitrificans]